ncbi:hypothetical protein B0H14DRAFT_523003 [Mycena olivaceomarginata]|nr:hypothetical protein B0H14DRAFT_523003 [Mycena olivaceomarginata]
MPHTTCATTSSAVRCPGGHLQHHDSARDPRALPFLPPPRARHHTNANTSPNRTTSRTRSTRRWRASPPTTPRRLLAHRDSSAVYCRHRPTPASAVLPSTTFIASCVRSAFDGRSPSPAPLLSPPRAPSASPASTTLPDPHARRVLACTTPRMRSTCSNRSPSPAPRLSPPCPPLTCPAPHYPPLEASSCPGPGVRRAASPERAASAMSIPRRPRRPHRLPGHRAYLLRRHQRPLETLACRAPRTGRVPFPVRSTRCSCPPIAPYPPRFPRPSSALYRAAR